VDKCYKLTDNKM